MADTTKSNIGTQANPSLTEDWVDILKANENAHPDLLARGDAYTPADLDAIALEYQNRDDTKKAPLSIGFPNEHQDSYGVVDAVRRKGDVLQARFSKVNPDLDHLYSRGVFTKKIASVKRTPEGIFLQRVGLAKPNGNNAWMSGRGTPPLKQMMGDMTSSRDHLFVESPGDWVEIFRAGDYRDRGKGVVTRDDLDRVVRGYDPNFHEAPISVGAPAMDKPAYGWISRLAVDGDVLLAKETQVDPWFAQTRKAGQFKKRSAGFYLNADGKIGGLRHVAYFGPQPPALDGLRMTQFKEGEASMIEFSSPNSSRGESPYVTALKETGRWLAYYEEAGLPALFDRLVAVQVPIEFGEVGERRRTSPAQLFAEFLAAGWRNWENWDLDRRARHLSYQRSISYGEALTRANDERVQVQREAMFAENRGTPAPVPGDDSAWGSGADATEQDRIKQSLAAVAKRTGGGRDVPFRNKVLNQTAQRYAQSKNIAFGDALSRVIEAVEPQAAELARTQHLSYDDAVDAVLADQSSAWMKNLN